MIEWIAAITLVVIGVVHSVVGESDILRPLFANETLTGKYPRWAVQRLLRAAWHLTTFAWVGLAAVLVGAPVEVTFGAVCLASGALIFAMLPGHLAWPLFLVAGLLGLWAGGEFPAAVLWVAVGSGVAVALVAAAFHGAWALGSRLGMDNVLPQERSTGAPLRVPTPWLTALVAFALVAYAVIAITATQVAGGPVRWAAIAALVVFIARVFGEGRYVGVLKSERSTGFARADDKYWTPLVAVLALSAASALVLGA